MTEGVETDSSESEEEIDFASNFHFVDTAAEYVKDTWSNLAKLVKKNKRANVNDKIAKSISKRKAEVAEEDAPEDTGDDLEIDEDSTENIKDTLKAKKKKLKKTKDVKNEADDDEVDVTSAFFGDEETSFQLMNLSRPLQKALTAMNFVHPTPIQSAAIPVGLLGRDIYGCAATGTGKTAAFMLPVLERLLYKPKQDLVTRVLVVVPTRELAVQVYQVSLQLAQFTNVEIALSAGGLDLKAQEAALRKIPDVIIATPGRLIDHLQNTPGFDVRNIEVLILDEADKMLEDTFAEQMKEIIRQCSPTRQTMLFSATMTDQVKDLAAVSLRKPVKLFLNNNTDVALNLRQEFIRIRQHKEGDREAILAALVSRNFKENTIVFVQTKKLAHRLRILLGLIGVRVDELHGNLNQAQRLDALHKFKEREVDVLITTDLVARGLDIKDVKTVINFTLPHTLQHYVHRVGRTARAGRSGRSVSLVGEQERKLLKEIVKQARTPVKQRIIPQEVISKLREKMSQLEEEVENILKEEKVEKELGNMEKEVQRADEVLSKSNQAPGKDGKRNWFQTPKEKFQEKARLRLGEHSSVTRRKAGKVPERAKNAEDRVSRELEKTAQYQARLAKRAKKPKRIRAITEDDDGKKQLPKGKKSRKKNFASELVDTSKKAVKKFRHGPSYQERLDAGLIKKNKGPAKKFKSKSRYRRK
ncbi:probable ATP-dependent RNA helicase DDX27 [Ornithodoros turicata]|uniref:probable ATP-dependent RNA helicase DDX27 n=1 Tax=Ornithodoros turicata TaxID=34597 RepID=UPI003139F900